MIDLADSASAWLDQQLGDHLSGDVVYSRGAESVTLAAAIGQTPFRMGGDDDGSVVVRMRDYLIASADLVLSGAQVEPQVGDRITETGADSIVRVYEVLPADNGEPAWRYSDSYHRMLRVHTKLITVTPATADDCLVDSVTRVSALGYRWAFDHSVTVNLAGTFNEFIIVHDGVSYWPTRMIAADDASVTLEYPKFALTEPTWMMDSAPSHVTPIEATWLIPQEGIITDW